MRSDSYFLLLILPSLSSNKTYNVYALQTMFPPLFLWYLPRWGVFQPFPTVASGGSQGLDGALPTNTHTGSSFSNPSWDVTYGRYTTAATANSQGGIISPTSGIGPAITNMATRAIARIRLNSTTSIRNYFEFTSNTTLPITDTPLGSDSGVMIGYRSTDSQWRMFNNNGTGPLVATSLGRAIDTNWHTVMICLQFNSSFTRGYLLSHSPYSFNREIIRIPISEIHVRETEYLLTR
jgi:hypothetical protein